MGKPETMVCSKCGEEKPFTPEYFYVDATRPFGMRKYCRKCRNKWRRTRTHDDYICDWCKENNAKGQIQNGVGFCSDQCRAAYRDCETATEENKTYIPKAKIENAKKKTWKLCDFADELSVSIKQAKKWALIYGIEPPSLTTMIGRVVDRYGEQIENMTGNMPICDIADTLGLSNSQVSSAQNQIGIENTYLTKGRAWDSKEEQYLRMNYLDKTDKQMGRHLDRTRQSITLKRRKLGLTKRDKAPVNRMDLWDKRQIIVDEYEGGTPSGTLAKQHNTGRSTIHRILDDCGCDVQSKGYANRKLPKNRLNKKMHDGMWRSFNGKPTQHTWQEYVPYKVAELKQHLEAQWEDGMTWDNFGRGGWHLDHIRPVSSFEFSEPTDAEFQQCWALSNLQPLWEYDNISKSNQWDGQVRLALS